MMKVKNGKCIRHLSFKTMMASKNRNIIAVIAIALTTLMFTALFTVVLSFNSSYQYYLSRQAGGYAHGSFKSVNQDEIKKISEHRLIKETGIRTLVGFANEKPFVKEGAEISFMDANDTKWNYSLPVEGRMPEKVDEVSMDRRALELLGAKGEIGEKITITYNLFGSNGEGQEITDTFTLSGIFEYDSLMPTHLINVSKEYVDGKRNLAIESGIGDFQTDLYVMLSNSLNTRNKLESVGNDLGIDDNKIGVNWSYTGSSLSIEPEGLVAIVSFLLLVIFAGYLVIYNIFQISVTGDIRFYGLLKTIGVTPKQLKRIIRNQALMLCVPGIPLGFLAGFGAGVLILPLVMESTVYGASSSKISTSPVIFLTAALFSVVTVLVSCRKPGKIVAKISPIEASKYTDNVKKATKKSRTVNGFKLALSNLGRNRKKTTLVIVSLSLSLVLLNVLFIFVNGFDEQKYIDRTKTFDFMISSAEYFRGDHATEYISEDLIEDIKENVHSSEIGCLYMTNGPVQAWMKEVGWIADARKWGMSEPEKAINYRERRDGLVKDFSTIKGFDVELMDKLTLLEGSLEPLKQNGGKYIAIEMPEYVDASNIPRKNYPKVGEKITVVYGEYYDVIDIRTGEPADEKTPKEYTYSSAGNTIETEYTVCAYVTVPFEIGFRRDEPGYGLVLNKDTFMADSVWEVIPTYVAIDTDNPEDEALIENYLANLTADDSNSIVYESKETIRAEFMQFKHMFIMVGGVLCAIIGLVGILNFFNAVMTEIISRSKELAVLQAIGMTGKQLKQMLITEGLLFAGGSALLALIISLILNPLEIAAINSMMWFCTGKFTILPVVITFPVFVIIALGVSILLYNKMQKESVVERIREING